VVPWIALFAGGCDVPTGLPVLETEWTAPGPSTLVPSAAFLPSDATVSDDGASATVALLRADSTVTPRGMCGACAGFEGLRVLKPAFATTLELAVPIPGELRGGELVSGEVEVELRHAMGFDPLQPGLGNTGTLRLEVRSGDEALGTLVLDGATDAFPSGQPLRRTIPLEAGGSVAEGPLILRATLDSPLGAVALINGNATLTAVAPEGALVFSRLRVAPADQPAPMNPTLFRVAGIGAAAATRVTGGILDLRLSNPFGRPLDLVIRVEGGGFETIERSVAVPADASSRVPVEFTPEELLLFLGLSSVRLRGDARMVDAEPLSLRPADALGLESEWVFQMRTGGS
jgi:hypothetical protein